MADYAWRRIADDIRSSIEDGTYKSGERLPTTQELCELHGVSKITVKRAMDELGRAGLVTRRRGSGTYVCEPSEPSEAKGMGWNFEGQMDGFTSECLERGLTPSVHLILFEFAHPTHEAARSLGVSQAEPCHHFHRVLLADGVPQIDEESFVPFLRAPELSRRDVEGSLFAYVGYKLGLTIASTRREIEATHADAEVAERLQISTDDPVLVVTQVSYLVDGSAIEVSRAIHAPGYEYLATRGL